MTGRNGVACSLLTVCCLLGVVAPAVGQQPQTTAPRNVQGELDPYVVKLYSDLNYKKLLFEWTLAPGKRLSLISSISGPPLSILLGDRVGALLFPNPNGASSRSRALLDVRTKEGGEMHFRLVPYIKIPGSTPKIPHASHYCLNVGECFATAGADWAFRNFSMVVYRKDVPDMLGVVLEVENRSSQFYALPESNSETASVYLAIPEGGPFLLHLIPGGAGGMSVAPSMSQPNLFDLAVTVNRDDGSALNLPDPNSQTATFELTRKFGVNQISSIRLQYQGQVTPERYQPTSRERAPAVALREGTSTSVSRERAPAAPDSVPAGPLRSAVVDVSGPWKGPMGVAYQFTQNGGQFSWTVALTGEKAAGTLAGMNVTAQWSGPLGEGSAKGKITNVDLGGRASRIEWSNGAVFVR
jgi:hypothetical protein